MKIYFDKIAEIRNTVTQNLDLPKFSQTNLNNELSGILRFLLTFEKITGKHENQEIINSVADRLADYCINTKNKDFSFLSGKAGAISALLTLYKSQNDNKKLAEQIREISDINFMPFVDSTYIDDSLLKGRSGLLIVLINLYSVSRNENLLPQIKQCFNRILENCKFGKQGIYLETEETNIKPLICLGFGIAGLGYAFSEIAGAFQNKNLLLISEQIRKYENLFWIKEYENWGDFRKNISTVEEHNLHKTKYLNSDIDFFTKPQDTVSLFHGTTGIGLSRLKSYQITKDRRFLSDILKTDKKLKTGDETEDCSVSDGLAGIVLFYIEAYQILQQKKYLDSAYHFAQKILNQIEISVKNQASAFGFFNEISGVGLVLAKLINYDSTGNLIPEIDIDRESKQSLSEIFNISEDEIKKKILFLSYPRTSEFIQINKPDLINSYCKNENFGAYDFAQFINRFFEPTEISARIKDIFRLENRKKKIAEQVQSQALQNIKNIFAQINIEKLRNLDDAVFAETKFQISKNIEFIKTRWNWNPEQNLNEIVNQEKSINPILIYPTDRGVEEMYISEIALLILNLFEMPSKKEDAKRIFFESINVEDITTEEVVEMFSDYINLFLKIGALVDVQFMETEMDLKLNKKM